jgi:hypothetical protein
MRVNYHKTFEYLGNFEKFNPRYLMAENYLIESIPEVFWGLLDDIYHYYHGKVSPFDKRFHVESQ